MTSRLPPERVTDPDRRERSPTGPFGTVPQEPPRRSRGIRRLFRALPLLFLLGVVALMYAAPYRTMTRLREAAAHYDAALLARDVDDQALRASLRATLAERMIARSTGASRDNPFSAAVSSVAASFMGATVDRMVSPQGLARLFDGIAEVPAGPSAAATPAAPAGSVASAGPAAPDGSAAPATSAAPAARERQPAPAARPDIDQGYEDFNRFSAIIRNPRQPQRPVTLLLTRHHLFWWRLTAVRLPE